jgi:hypothetical protein
MGNESGASNHCSNKIMGNIILDMINYEDIVEDFILRNTGRTILFSRR